MTTPRGGLPFVWCTWLSGVLAGDRQCLWAPWFRSHFRFDKRPDSTFNLAAWSAEHNALVDIRRQELEAEGWTVTIENENAFRWHGKTAILAGKPDLIARRPGEFLVVDGKTGQQRNSDWWQVLIYLVALPPVFGAGHWRGEVLYKNQHRVAIEPEELTPERREQIFARLRTCGSSDRPAKTPSVTECRFCDITASDCPEGQACLDNAPVPVLASEF